jgi:hypothetical protein
MVIDISRFIADTELARSLVTLLCQDSPVAGLCSVDPNSWAGSSRCLLLLLGLSPCRTQAWSQARIPREARLQVHLFSGVPALVIPVTAKAPILAWSPWTLKQMHGMGSDYRPETHYQELCSYLEGIIHTEQVESPYTGNHRDMVGQTVWSVIQGALGTRCLGQEVMGGVDTERAGIVLMRY